MKLAWSWGDNLPTSYLVQEYQDPVTGQYLADLGVQVVELFSWNELPRFLWAINPTEGRLSTSRTR
jgi:hypothetical protein